MGMYTELRGTVLFKSESVAKAFATCHCDSVWEMIHSITNEPMIKDFDLYSRSHWIPHSGNGVKSQEGLVVKFHCELKNYDNTIEKFLDVLPKIADDWLLEKRYEEYYHWTLFRKGEESSYVNGDNTHQMDYPFNKDSYESYPDFDVFDLSNIKKAVARTTPQTINKEKK